MAHKKAAGSAKNLRDSNPKYRGVKIYGGQLASAGAIIIRQKGDKYKAGENVYLGKDFTIHAEAEGVVSFRKKKVMRYDGRKYTKTFVDILPLGTEPKGPKKAAPKKSVAKKSIEKKAAAPKATKTEKKETTKDLSSMTVKELKAKAKEMEISGYSTMKKDELLAAVK